MAQVRLFGAARAAAGTTEIHLAATTLGDLLTKLEQNFAAIAPVLVKCSYLVNEVSCRDMSTALRDTDVVDVLPPFAGGSQ